MRRQNANIIDKPRRGRPPLPDYERKARISLSVSKSAVRYLDSARGNSSRSEFVQNILASTEYAGDPSLIRRNGAVYTPRSLAEYVAHEAIKGVVKSREKGCSPTPIEQLKILDPACGSGELLLAAWKALSEHISSHQNGRCVLPFDAREILYGIDIDREATRHTATRVASLNSGKEGDAIQSHILCTNALFPFGAKTSEAGWKRASNYFGVDGGFDVVIANPPWGADVSEYRDKLTRDEFMLFQGQFDTSDLFLELALRVTKPGGHIAFIVPDSLFSLERAPLRRMLLERTRLHLVARLGEKVFDGINRACAVVVCQKSKPHVSSKVRCFHLTPDARRNILSGKSDFSSADRKLSHRVLQSRFGHNDQYALNIDVTDKEECLIRHMEGSSRLDTFLTSTRGVELSKTGMVAKCRKCHHWFPAPSRKHFECPSCGIIEEATGMITRSIVHDQERLDTAPFYVGESLSRYSIASPFWIERDIPGINYKHEKTYSGPKILVRKTGVGISAHIDYSSTLTNQVVYILRVKKEKTPVQLPLELFLAILNSRAMYYYLTSRHGEREWRSHPYVTQTQLMSLPAPPSPNLKKNKEEVERICNLIREKSTNGKNLSSQDDAQIESLVAKLYGLNKKHYGMIYSMIDSVQDLLPVRALKRVELKDILKYLDN